MKTLPAERVLAARAVRDKIDGPADALKLWQDAAVVCDESSPLDNQYPPLRPLSEKQARYLVTLLRQAKLTGVPDADADLWRLVHQPRMSPLIDELRRLAGEEVKDFTPADRDAYRRKKALERPLRGLDKLPFTLTDSQLAFVNKLRSDRDVKDAAITGYTKERAVKLTRYYRRGRRFTQAYDRWVYPTAAAQRAAEERHRAKKEETA